MNCENNNDAVSCGYYEYWVKWGTRTEIFKFFYYPEFENNHKLLYSINDPE